MLVSAVHRLMDKARDVDPLKICFVASEVAPFSKTGGLADVANALPSFLHRSGHDVRVFAPRYASIDLSEHEHHPVDFVRDVPLRFGSRDIRFSVVTVRIPGGGPWIYLIDCPELYSRDQLYTSDPDEYLRFATLARGAIACCQRMGWGPDVFHCNDWHAALVPLYLRALYAWDGLFRRSRTVLTIHNIAYQGKFPSAVIEELGLAEHAGGLDRGDLLDGTINFLKTGILHADVVTTVSRTYAREIQSPAFGEGLDDLLRRRPVIGIVNGVDYDQWNPETDPLIPFNYSRDDPGPKRRNKEALLDALGLDHHAGAAVLGIISRLTAQKGIELFYPTLPELLTREPVRVVTLGSGMEEYERFFSSLQDAYPDRVRFYRGFNNRLAHLIEAGADLFLMPSRFEPCGLNQMYSLRYGTPPVVRKTGGLADTVTMFDPRTGEGDGFVFEHFTPDGLRWGLGVALEVYRDADAWRRITVNAMSRNWSWDVQGQEYVSLYSRLTA